MNSPLHLPDQVASLARTLARGSATISQDFAEFALTHQTRSLPTRRCHRRLGRQRLSTQIRPAERPSNPRVFGFGLCPPSESFASLRFTWQNYVDIAMIKTNRPGSHYLLMGRVRRLLSIPSVQDRWSDMIGKISWSRRSVSAGGTWPLEWFSLLWCSSAQWLGMFLFDLFSVHIFARSDPLLSIGRREALFTGQLLNG